MIGVVDVGGGLRGVYTVGVLDAFLERHPEIEEIEICTNNDFAGRWAASHIERAYQGRYRMVKNLPRREGCDYGDLAKENYERRAARSLSDGSR